MQAASSRPPETVPPLDVVIPVMVCLSMQWGKELSSCVREAALYGLLLVLCYWLLVSRASGIYPIIRASATPLYGKFW